MKMSRKHEASPRHDNSRRMRLITHREEVLDRLILAGRTQIPILSPNAETPDEMEGVLLAAENHARAFGRERCTVGLGFTATYPDHPQLSGLAIEGGRGQTGTEATAELWLHWLRAYDRSGLFDRVEVIPFLDHGWAPHPEDLRLMQAPWFQEAMGIIMFDASALELEENVRLTSAFVQIARNRVVVEACPDKVYERAQMETHRFRESDLWSRPEVVEQFVRRTGVDLIVPNLGTEHRTVSDEPLDYQHGIAREIARRVGPIQSLHGTSSLGGRLASVGVEGIVKINYYTAMARSATGALQKAWAAHTVGAPLPINQACGSFLHRTRRRAIADNVERILSQLERRERS